MECEEDVSAQPVMVDIQMMTNILSEYLNIE